jgi:hypothetical protein
MSATRQARGMCLMAVPYWYAHGRTDGRTYGRSSYFRRDMTLSHAREQRRFR